MIPEINGIALDESGATPTSASCNQDNGTITGILAPGATQYQWFNASGNIVSTSATSADLSSAPAGDYYLVVSNSSCSKTSSTYHISKLLPVQFPAFQTDVANTCTGQNTGYVHVQLSNDVKSARWADAANQPAGTGGSIDNLAPGTYSLYLTDVNGCENLYQQYEVKEITFPVIASGSESINPDYCGLKTGSITGIQLTGGLPPYTYVWLSPDGTVAGTTLDINGLAVGTYTLMVTAFCGPVTKEYVVPAQASAIAAPSADNVEICSPGDAIINVNNVQSQYSYRLYDSENATTPLDEKASGKFKVSAKSTTTFYLSQVNGTCESDRTAVKVVVGLSGVNINNVITPNGDGINDYWTLKGMENYPSADVEVFNRNGQRVFRSKGYSNPFDGTSNGKALPVGTYYYIIKLNNDCNLISGSLTIIR